MKLKHHILVILLILIATQSEAQFKIENWKVHSSLIDLKTVDYDSQDRIWAGGYGGCLMYDEKKDEIKEFRNIDALLSLEISTIKCYREKQLIFIGSYDGVFSILTEDFQWKHYTEIRSFGFPKAAINDFIFDGDIVYIAGDFGIAIFDIKERIFVAQALRLGEFQQNTPVNDILINDNQLWAATSEGIAFINMNSFHSYPPNSWQNFTRKNGLLNMKIEGIAFHQDTLFAYDAEYLYKKNLDSFEIIAVHNKNDEWMCGLQEDNGTLYYATRFGLKIHPATPILFDSPGLINGFTIGRNGEIITLFNERGFGKVANWELTLHKIPNTPSSNLFLNLNVSENGDLWVATGYEPGMGAMTLRNGQWSNINMYNYKELTTNNIINAKPIKDKGVFLGTWGGGLYILNEINGNFSFQKLDNANSPLTGIAENQDWVITADTDIDRYGNIWTLNYGGASPGTFLLVHQKNGGLIGIERFAGSNNRWCRELQIDNFNTKWAASARSDGLYYFNDNGTPDNFSDDIYGVINSNNSGLLDNTQYALDIDNQGRLWIGTPEGLCVLLNPSIVLSKGVPVIREIRALGRQIVNDVMVDALNYVWVATTTGVWIIDAEEDAVIASLTTSNSPLITNDIKSLATNKENGTIYIGTRAALYEANSMSVKPLASYQINCYPQPFYPDRDEQLVIDGLAENSDIRITTLNGEFVRSIISKGKKALWDGRDSKGNYIQSGIYIISTSSLTSSASAAGKIAVIRK